MSTYIVNLKTTYRIPSTGPDYYQLVKELGKEVTALFMKTKGLLPDMKLLGMIDSVKQHSKQKDAGNVLFFGIMIHGVDMRTDSKRAPVYFVTKNEKGEVTGKTEIADDQAIVDYLMSAFSFCDNC